MIYDIFTFNGEYDILEIHLNILENYVDQFIIIEAPTTFSGLEKPLYYEQGKERFKKWWPKIKYFVIDENYSREEIALAENSPNTKGAAHWKREFLQKESIKKALTHIKDDDICYIGDVDEIWQSGIHTQQILRLKLRTYVYYLNNRSTEEFWGTIVAPYRLIKNSCLNHIRSSNQKTKEYAGWHFTSQGGYKELKRKLGDSYTTESFWNMRTRLLLKLRLWMNRDFLGRNFIYRKDESEWPQYLKDNKDRYKDLCL